jgi:hypothetical protein
MRFLLRYVVSQQQSVVGLELPRLLGVDDQSNGIGDAVIDVAGCYVTPGLRTGCFAVRCLEAELHLKGLGVSRVPCQCECIAFDSPHMTDVGTGPIETSQCLIRSG